MEIDPITFEVVNHRLWQINDEQGTTIILLSPSPVVVEGTDFNVGLFTKDGDLVTAGIYIMFHVTAMETVVKNIIRTGWVPDLKPGDMLLTNDPYMGALHQNDVCIIAPIFHDGELVYWAGNVAHWPDVGGCDPGSFCVNARHIFDEPPRYYLKVVSEGKFGKEVEKTVMINSRQPDELALNLRAQIGAINVVKQRLEELVHEVGLETILGTMQLSIRYAREKLSKRIAEIPDGKWSTEAFMDGERAHSLRIFRIHVSLEKRGDKLYFDYTGTDPQVVGPVNCMFPVCRAVTMIPVFAILCGNEIDWNRGAMDCVEVYAPEGTLVNAKAPAAVSMFSGGCARVASQACTKLVAEMLLRSEKHRDLVCPSWSPSTAGIRLSGPDKSGKIVGGLFSDHRANGAGARSFADGIDHVGMIESCFSFMANVETNEFKAPNMIYVFRRRLCDSGGPGKFRGGLSAIAALTPYDVESLDWVGTNTAGADESNASGISGGYPGAGCPAVLIRGSRVWEMLRHGEVPTSYKDWGGKVEYLATKSDGVVKAGDMLIYYPPGGGGYGDPLERDPEMVREDVLKHAVSIESAQERYGVILTPGFEVDEAATKERRREMVASRLPSHIDGEGLRIPTEKVRAVRSIGEYIEEVETDEGAVTRCSKCGHVYGPKEHNPKKFAVRRLEPLSKAGPWLCLRWNGDSPNFTLVTYVCPECGVLFETEERLKADLKESSGNL